MWKTVVLPVIFNCRQICISASKTSVAEPRSIFWAAPATTVLWLNKRYMKIHIISVVEPLSRFWRLPDCFYLVIFKANNYSLVAINENIESRIWSRRDSGVGQKKDLLRKHCILQLKNNFFIFTLCLLTTFFPIYLPFRCLVIQAIWTVFTWLYFYSITLHVN